MADDFDPYHKWLGVPPKEQPPHRYRLLGLALYEEDADVIESAVDQRMAHVRTHQTGKHGILSQRILNELAEAKLCLLKPESKRDYDDQLKRRLEGAIHPQPAPVAAAPRPIALAAPMPSSASSAPPSKSIGIRRRRSNSNSAIVAVGATAALFVAAALAWRFMAAGQAPRETTTRDPETRRPEVAIARDTVETVAARSDEQVATHTADDAPSTENLQGARETAAAARPREPVPDAEVGESRRDPSQNIATSAANDNGLPAAEPSVTPQPTLPSEVSVHERRTKKAAAPRRPKLAPKGAIYHGDNWYWFSDRKGTFQEAQQIANRLKGRLVTITSDDENQFVAGHIQGPTFLGLLKVKGAWLDPSGRPQEYFHWDRGQPSRSKDERFAAIHAGGGWHDYLPDRLFVCIEWGKEP